MLCSSLFLLFFIEGKLLYRILLFSVKPQYESVACQAPLAVGFFTQEYWSGLSFSLPGRLRNPGIEPLSLVSPALQVDS